MTYKKQKPSQLRWLFLYKTLNDSFESREKIIGLDTSAYADGEYIISARTNNNSAFTKKFIISRDQ